MNDRKAIGTEDTLIAGIASDPLTRDLSSQERELVRRYVERRESLTAESRDALATRIATAIRPKLGASYAHLSDDTLLVHLSETSLA